MAEPATGDRGMAGATAGIRLRKRRLPQALLAGGAASGFEALHLRIALGAEAAVDGLAVLLRAGAVVKSGVRIDPDLDGRVSLQMDHGCWSFGDSQFDERFVPQTERCSSRRARRRPEQGEHGYEEGHAQINVGAVDTQRHAPVGYTLKAGTGGAVAGLRRRKSVAGRQRDGLDGSVGVGPIRVF